MEIRVKEEAVVKRTYTLEMSEDQFLVLTAMAGRTPYTSVRLFFCGNPELMPSFSDEEIDDFLYTFYSSLRETIVKKKPHIEIK